MSHSNAVTTMLFNSGVFKRPKSYFFKLVSSFQAAAHEAVLNDGSAACWMCGIFYLLQLHLIQVPIQGLYSSSPYSCNVTF